MWAPELSGRTCRTVQASSPNASHTRRQQAHANSRRVWSTVCSFVGRASAAPVPRRRLAQCRPASDQVPVVVQRPTRDFAHRHGTSRRCASMGIGSSFDSHSASVIGRSWIAVPRLPRLLLPGLVLARTYRTRRVSHAKKSPAYYCPGCEQLHPPGWRTSIRLTSGIPASRATIESSFAASLSRTSNVNRARFLRTFRS